MKRLLIICAVLFTACGGGGENNINNPDNCTSEVNQIVSVYGAADDILYYHGDTYDVYGYFYFCHGIAFDFVWGDSIEGCYVTSEPVIKNPMCY